MGEEGFKLWWDAEEEIVRARAFGVLDDESAEGIKQETARMAEEHGGGLDWLIDLNQMTKATSKARKLLAEASGHPSICRYTFARVCPIGCPSLSRGTTVTPLGHTCSEAPHRKRRPFLEAAWVSRQHAVSLVSRRILPKVLNTSYIELAALVGGENSGPSRYCPNRDGALADFARSVSLTASRSVYESST